MISLKELADVLGAELLGDAEHQIDSCATLNTAKENQLSFIYNKKYAVELKNTKAGVVILSAPFVDDFSGNILLVSNPYLAYAQATTFIYKKPQESGEIHPTAVIAENAQIAKSCVIGANVVIAENVIIDNDCTVSSGCFIGDNVIMGKNVNLLPNVTVCSGTRIGNNVTIHPGAVIGSDGFGYAPLANKEGWFKIPQIGHVIIGNNVDIGANTTIDCGALENTVIGNGVKIDNQVMIAHNVEIGEHTAIAGCTGIAGSAKIGSHCTLAGGVGLVGHISIADGVHVTGMTMVTHSIKKAGAYSSGTPFQANSDWLKNAVRFKQLDKLTKKINQLIKSQKGT
ncbi:MAG: UDP-3-O-(3-hydroxymyristoyl)glucosamine N-acyltransferase [Cycloclasticus sp. symbiont of Bathymodiolus heckerae]|nr:MAG: UDP-3-O-(3-hydroxymyristoyl)glucosamine N-acyltransferase [Cycloclasticus sp. symbiont of Bathymodiolus heckerae]